MAPTNRTSSLKGGKTGPSKLAPRTLSSKDGKAGERKFQGSDATTTNRMPGSRKSTAIRKSGKTSKTETFVAGRITEPKNFISVEQIEASLAAYLGYNDIADLRRFVSTHHFLKHWFNYSGKWSSGLHKKAPLEQIRDRYLKNRKADFPLDSLDKYKVVEKPEYTTKEALVRNKRLAHVIIIFVEETSALDPEVLVNSEEQQEYITRLTAEFGTMCTNPPDLSGETVKVPKLKTDFKETELEKFNRALNLLKYFSLVVNSRSRYKTRFESKNWQESVRVEPVYVPMWMQDLSKTSLKIQDTEADKHKSLVKIPIKLELKKKGGSAEERAKVQECNEYMEEEGIIIDPSQDAHGDPRVHSQMQFRDSIRHQMQCLEHNLQLSSVSMSIPPANPDDEEAEEKEYDLFDCDWEDLRAELRSTFGDGTAKNVTSTITVDVRLRRLDVDSKEAAMECKRPADTMSLQLPYGTSY
ncbi:hypothetical protein KC318_g1570 [Hortaea werneckii]|nr:hypothetical protein KC334_g3468 [Hortaea werneckii]KAI7024034.1 hypothetical protein KC355_g1538 [Hortaea werneckii]KAI7199280.1 hypothetical protein KC324_g3346 [Hortaea werneckii]KAI7590165.1 hypothetical protein KC316_g3527 [Hortaea werneckii]KAI7674479.1 hypothetical protein KC318_g1570 [Hortaea werneckii]